MNSLTEWQWRVCSPKLRVAALGEDLGVTRTLDEVELARQMGDERGWLHIYDENLLRAFGDATRPSADFFKRRPLLELAVNHDSMLRPALRAEIEYSHELDRVRMGIYEKAVRRYMVEVRKSRLPPGAGLSAQHGLRVRCAEKYLPINPLRDFGVTRMISEARELLAQIIHPAAMAWLPDVREHFRLATA